MPRKKTQKSEKEWKGVLAPEAFRVLRQGHTEQPFSGRYHDFWEDGVYVCNACRTPLFRSEAKYDHGTGWPSFSVPVDEKNLVYRDDFSLLVKRVEVRCAVCGSHLGHVFDDGPAPTFLHYCINSAALDFIPAGPDPRTARKPGAKKPGPAAEDGTGAGGKAGPKQAG
ncbi:MAG TPA: peptide-methionine (R)-S-oxide reductase MsrB [Terriglobales bacterium]|nr:peptide-methionine (R)-S-oxide reductase MsrB [Terriglobales bacterium]